MMNLHLNWMRNNNNAEYTVAHRRNDQSSSGTEFHFHELFFDGGFEIDMQGWKPQPSPS